MSEKVTFKTINVDTQKFLNVYNPDTQIKNNDGILSYNTGVYGGKDNAFPDFLIDLYINGSAVHQNLVNLKGNLILGNNLQAEDDTQSSLVDPFIAKRNKSGDNLKTVYAKCSKDFALFDACVLQVIFNRNGEIAEVYHIPTQHFRLGAPNKYGQSEYGYISHTWAYISNSMEQRKKESVRIRMWSPDQWEKYPTQLLYLKSFGYTPYAIPSYNSGIGWILIDKEIQNFHLNNIKTNFFLAGMLTQIKGAMTAEEIDSNAREIEGFYSGSKGRKVLLSYVDNIADKPVFDQFGGGEQDKLFEILQNQCYQSLITAHNAYPILGGLDTKSADLGGSENKLNTALLSFNQLVTEPMKTIVVDGINRILQINSLPVVTVITEPLRLTLPIAQPDDTTKNERRSILYGLPEIDESANNANNDNEIPT